MASDYVVEFSAEHFASQISGNQPVLVDFYSTWCSPCRAMEPVVNSIAETFKGLIDVMKVNVDDAPELATRYRIRSVPTLVFLSEGQETARITGLIKGRDLVDLIEKYLEDSKTSSRPTVAA